MTTSVCMGIYNGEKYIEEQLNTIFHQTKEPEEVVLCDDGSTDQTVAIVQRFIEKNRLQGKWHLFCNEQNKGYPANFYYAMSLCTQDIVFLADQDDIWADTKLERMCAVLEQHQEAKAVCCKFGLIDGEGKKIQSFMSPTHSKDTGELRKVDIEGVFYKCEWPGMVVAYQNEWYQKWRKQFIGRQEKSCPTIPHDFLICARAAEEESFFQMDEELAWHRRHDNNTGGEEHHVRSLLKKQRKLKEIEDYLVILDAFEKEEILLTDKGKVTLCQKQQSMRGRYDALQSGKIINVINNAMIQKERVRLVTVLCDILIVRNKGREG